MYGDNLSGDDYGLNGNGGAGATPSSAWSPSYAAKPTNAWRAPTAARTQMPSGSNGFTDPSQATFQPSYATSANASSSGTPNTDPVTADRTARNTYATLKAAGHDVKWQGNQLMVDGRPYTINSGNGATQGQTMASSGGADLSGVDWSGMDPRLAALYQKYGKAPTGPGTGLTDSAYWNGKITGGDSAYFLDRLDKDLAGNGMDTGGGGSAPGWTPTYYQAPNLQAPWGADGPAVYNPGNITFDDIPNFTREQLMQEMEGSPTSQNYEGLLNNILTNPTALDDHTVDTMKAQMKDTLAQQGQFQDQNLRGQGAVLGSSVADSPWLASERAAADRSTGQAIASGNQNIDIQAAQTRMNDKRAAAGLGAQYQSQKAAEVNQSVSAALQRATVTGDRMQLRESVAQAAAASRQSAQSIMANWLVQNANLGLSYDQLNSQNSQYLESLMMQAAQFNANSANQPPDPTAMGY
jgi:hypothetical protein